MARLLLQPHKAQLRSASLAIVICFAGGCAKPSGQPSGGPAPTPLTQKLQTMTPEQRTQYVKTHMDEVAASAGATGIPRK